MSEDLNKEIWEHMRDRGEEMEEEQRQEQWERLNVSFANKALASNAILY